MSCPCQGHRKGHWTPRAVPEICHHKHPTNTGGYKVLPFGIVLTHMKLGILICFVYRFPPIQRNFYQGKLLSRQSTTQWLFTKITRYRLFSSKHLCSCLPVYIDTFTHVSSLLTLENTNVFPLLSVRFGYHTFSKQIIWRPVTVSSNSSTIPIRCITNWEL